MEIIKEEITMEIIDAINTFITIISIMPVCSISIALIGVLLINLYIISKTP